MYKQDREGDRAPIAHRASAALDRAERVYLRVLRAAILVIATLLLLYAAWLALSSLYKMSRSTESVIEETASVQPDEITDAQAPSAAKIATKNAEPSVDPATRAFYRDFARRYYNLYRTKFEPYRQADDKQLTLEEFDDSFLNTSERLEAATKGNLNFADDQSDLETMLNVMTEAAATPATSERLARYKAARKVPVKRQVERTRTEYRRGWDSSSTACSDWYETPYGCSVIRPVYTPYTETVTELQFPEGTQSHTQIFRAFQDRYFNLLEERREANAAKAEHERQDILSGFLEGKLSLMTALQVLAGFMILMFFFLLIAIERHQRRIAADLATDGPAS